MFARKVSSFRDMASPPPRTRGDCGMRDGTPHWLNAARWVTIRWLVCRPRGRTQPEGILRCTSAHLRRSPFPTLQSRRGNRLTRYEADHSLSTPTYLASRSGEHSILRQIKSLTQKEGKSSLSEAPRIKNLWIAPQLRFDLWKVPHEISDNKELKNFFNRFSWMFRIPWRKFHSTWEQTRIREDYLNATKGNRGAEYMVAGTTQRSVPLNAWNSWAFWSFKTNDRIQNENYNIPTKQ